MGCVTPPAMGTAPSHRYCHQLSGLALTPPHPRLAACSQGWEHILVHTGHLQEAGGSPGPWPRWAAGCGRTQQYGDLWG